MKNLYSNGIKFFAACFTLAAVAAVPVCEIPAIDQLDNMAENDKILHVQNEPTSEGTKTYVKCGARGPKTADDGTAINVIQDPAVWFSQVIGNVDFHSIMPCDFARTLGGFTSDKGPGEGSTGVPINSTSCGAKREFSSCEYPGTPSDETRWPERKFLGDEPQSSWVGAAYSISQVNDIPLDTLEGTVTHEAIYGANATSCELSDGDDKNGGGMPIIYDGGVMVTNKRGDDFTMRSFMFKNDDMRSAAMNDSRNLGLPFAKVFAGANGCDSEIVYDFKPTLGGGVSFRIALQLMSWSQESQEDLKNSASAYETSDEVVISVSTHALKRAHNLDYTPSCDPERTEIIRLAKTMVCAVNGSSKDITTITASVKDSSGTVSHETLSSDPDNPTTYLPQPRDVVNKFPGGSGLPDPNTDAVFHAFEIKFDISAADAPETCGTMYWDPLVLPVTGDGNSAMIGPESFLMIIIWTSITALVLIGVGLKYRQYRREKSNTQAVPSEDPEKANTNVVTTGNIEGGL